MLHQQIRPSISIRPTTTAHLAQTMSLLSLSIEELQQKIEAVLSTNPALEMINDRRCPNCQRKLSPSGVCLTCNKSTGLGVQSDDVVFISYRTDFPSPGSATTSHDASDDFVDLAQEKLELPEFVFRQIAIELNPDDRQIAAHILSNLDHNGLLNTSLFEIARYNHVSMERVSQVLRIIQRAEPVGVGSQTAQDALLAQLDALEMDANSKQKKIISFAKAAVKENLQLLGQNNESRLSKFLKIPKSAAKEIIGFVASNLNPFPAHAFWGSTASNSLGYNGYVTPDIIIGKINDNPDCPLKIEIIMPLAGTLRVNPLFKKALTNAPEDKKQQWNSELEEANLFVKCLQQRNHTIVQLMRLVVELQRDFILRGDAHLTPVTRASVAEALSVHESTISRAVSSKNIQLPNGRIIPFGKFFDKSLAARTIIKDMIAHETKPLTDSKIAELLENHDIFIKRRTVAKYRNMEGILAAHMRRKK